VRLVWLSGGAIVALAAHAYAKPAASHAAAHPAAAVAPHPMRRPAPPLPMLPRIAEVIVEVAHDRVVVVEDVALPRGDWESGGIDLFVAFGAPGTPGAFDARLVSSGPGADEGEQIAAESAVRRDSSEQPLLGPPLMAGVAVRIKEAQLQRAYARGDAVTLRLRSLLDVPAAANDGARDVVVRLGADEGRPLTLTRVEVRSLETRTTIVRAQASLCGDEADPWPLSVAVAGKGEAPRPRVAGSTTIAPELAVRHPGDDLCVRWWTAR
jgi:hypothetical protein